MYMDKNVIEHKILNKHYGKGENFISLSLSLSLSLITFSASSICT